MWQTLPKCHAICAWLAQGPDLFLLPRFEVARTCQVVEACNFPDRDSTHQWSGGGGGPQSIFSTAITTLGLQRPQYQRVYAVPTQSCARMHRIRTSCIIS